LRKWIIGVVLRIGWALHIMGAVLVFDERVSVLVEVGLERGGCFWRLELWHHPSLGKWLLGQILW
jgi:hypothetical protein